MTKLSLDYIKENTVMALEIETETGYRYWKFGTSEELKPEIEFAEKEYGGISDYDVACTNRQPEELKDFHEKWFQYIFKNRFIDMDEFYKIYEGGK